MLGRSFTQPDFRRTLSGTMSPGFRLRAAKTIPEASSQESMLPKENNTCETHMFFPSTHLQVVLQTVHQKCTVRATAPPLGYERENPSKASGFGRTASADPAAHEHSNLRMLLLLRNSLRTSELDEVTPRLVFPSKKPSARLLASFSRASPTHQQAGAHRAPSLSFRPRRHGLRHPG